MSTSSLSAGLEFPLPKLLTYPSSTPPELITQGAEGRIYKTTFLNPAIPCALKYRPSKPYRHPTLDARLTKQRIAAEARVLQRCQREGVAVPAVYHIDGESGILMMEWIQGAPVRARLNEWCKENAQTASETLESDPSLLRLLGSLGTVVGGMHRLGIVHGDLTTSNMMLSPWAADMANGQAAPGTLDGEIVIIDFGLATQNTIFEEDKAVDLYVLERAFASTHPQLEGAFQRVLDAYRDTSKQAASVLKRLEDVRMRGRKRSMLG